MRKKYEVAGMMEWHPIFMAGKTRVQVSFKGGNLCGGASTAASYETSDPVVQAVIEHSDAFRIGRIRLGRSWEECCTHSSRNSHDKKLSQNPQANKSTGVAKDKPKISKKSFRFEYQNMGQVTDLLHYDKGVPVERLLDEESCRKEAAILGIELIKKD
ncbi:MAG: hypothetical protein K2G13_06900 [Muribaculaceae bacterium]|nr:hypothetical protein [Muribaculaceae bacterium]